MAVTILCNGNPSTGQLRGFKGLVHLDYKKIDMFSSFEKQHVFPGTVSQLLETVVIQPTSY